MTSKLKTIVMNTGTAVGLTALSVAGGIGMLKYLDHVDPMGGSKPGYVVVKSGDTAIGLCKNEGWTEAEIGAHGVRNWNPNIYVGDILSIPQHEGNPYNELGLTGREVYESREAAEASKQ